MTAFDVLVAVPAESTFRFDGAAIAAAATERWPDAEELMAPADLADHVDRYVYVPTGQLRRFQLAVLRSGNGVGIDGPDEPEAAAEMLAWLAATTDPPPEAGAALLNWSEDLVPFTAALTAPELLRLR